MKKPNPKTASKSTWMKYVRSKKGKKKSRKSTKSKKTRRPKVTVSIPKGAKLVVKRKAKNPYYVEVRDDRDGQSSKKQIWYTPDYQKKH